MSARPTHRSHARRNLALAAVLGLTAGGLVTVPAATGNAAAPSAPQAGVSASAAEPGPVAEITRLEGVDTDGEAFTVTTTEVDGAPIVTGTSPDGTDANSDPTVSLENAYAKDYSELVEQAASASVPRLGGGSVYDTAVAVSQRAFADGGAETVYITRADRVGDALAAGALRDGPVLFVPRTGTAPSNVIAEVRRLGPQRVIALGGDQAVAPSVLSSASAGRPTSRLAGADSYRTAAAIAARAFPNGAPEVYLAGLRQGPGGAVSDSPDAAAGGVLTRGVVLPVPARGDVPQAVKDVVDRLRPSRVYALGGAAVVPAATLGGAAGGRATGRLTGGDRYETSAAIARHAFPRGAKVAYLVAGTSLAETVAGGSLTDGPILFTPPAGSAYRVPAGAISGVLTRLGVTSVGALGAATTLPASAVDAVVSGASTVTPGPLPPHPSGGDAPAPTESPSPAPTPTPTQSPAPTPSPTPTQTPAPTPRPSTWQPPVAPTCESLVTSFRPIRLPAPYTIGCVDSIGGDSRVLGLTSTRVYLHDESVASGSIQIVRGLSESMLKTTIAHEIAHAFSYGAITRNQRAWFVSELRKVDPNVVSSDFNDQTSYDYMPAEQWARGQAACAGWPDPYRRPTASCALIDGTIAGPR